VLSLFLCFGSPAVFPSRVLKYENALAILEDKTNLPSFDWLRKSPRIQLLVSAAQYILASIAIVNVNYTSYELGTRTSLSFYCLNSILPLVWTLLPVFVYLPSALAFYCANKSRRKPPPTMSTLHQGSQSHPTRDRPLRHPLQQTYQLPANNVLRHRLNYLATMLGFLHVTFGILIFSSLLFIETTDVAAVLVRYVVSALICRSILMFELWVFGG
jgi:hypothetical protein